MRLKFSQIQPLVSMVTDRVMLGKTVSPLFLGCFSIHSFLYLQVMIALMRALKSSNYSLIGPPTAELAALERLEKNPHRLIMGKKMSPIFLRCS